MKRRAAVFFGCAWGCALPCLAQSADPVGPAGWTARNWVGFAAQIAVFVLALIGICKLADWERD